MRKARATLLLLLFLFSSLPVIPFLQAEDPFKPEITLTKWDGESSLTIEYLSNDYDFFSRVVSKDETYWESLTQNVRFYKLPSLSNHEALYDYEVLLKVRPSSDIFTFRIDTENLVFYYQPPLNEEEYPEGFIKTVNATHAFDENGTKRFHRKENVVGSYAVFHTSKMNNGYTTGKFCHIYYPYFIDSNGWTVRARSFTISDGIMELVAPAGFLDTAVYPVVIDPTIGRTDVGATTSNQYGYLISSAVDVASGGNGALDSLWTYTVTAGSGIDRAIYDDDGGTPSPSNAFPETLIDSDLSGTSLAGDWLEQTGVSAAIVNDTQYWQSIKQHEDEDTLKLDSIANGEGKWGYGGGSPGDPFPATYPGCNNQWWRISMYAEYSVSGGATYNRSIVMTLLWAQQLSRTWNTSRALPLGLQWDQQPSRTWNTSRTLTLALHSIWEGFGQLTGADTFIRDLSLGLYLAQQLSRTWNTSRTLPLGLQWGQQPSRTWNTSRTLSLPLSYLLETISASGQVYIRDITLGLTTTIDAFGSWAASTGWHILNILVIHSSTGRPIEEVAINGWVTGGALTFSGLTNSTGQFNQTIQDNNYTMYAQDDLYYPQMIMFELTQDLNLEITLLPLEESVLFDVPMLVLAALSLFFTATWWNTPEGEDFAVGIAAGLLWFSLSFYWLFALTLTPVVSLALGIIGVYICLETFNATWEIWDL